MTQKKRESFGNLPARYSFARNQYENEKISKCPICRSNTFKRKFPLVVLVKDASVILSLGLTCKYCAKCEFIIAHKHELEQELCIAFEKIDSAKIGNDYLVIGTIEKNVWKKGLAQSESTGNIIDSIADFKKYLNVEITPAMWVAT